MSGYAPADTRTQWFENAYPGSVMKPNCVVLHTTESSGWPGYQGGAVAPNYTAHPNVAAKRLDWRQHFPDERSSRALENHPGGVETNTLNVVQVELVGTCDPLHKNHWGKLRAGVDYIYWPDAPEWALQAVADFLADQHRRHGTRLSTPKPWKSYRPDGVHTTGGSYGATNGVRMTYQEWLNFYGVCGHEHVPENAHGDPGDFPIDRVLAMAQAAVAPKPPRPDVVAMRAAVEPWTRKGRRARVRAAAIAFDQELARIERT